MINRAEVLQLFMRQHWVASNDQLRALSISSTMIQRSRRSGVVTSVIPGVLRLTGSPESFPSRAMALQLHVGGDVFISGASSAVLHGMREMPKRLIECTIGEDRKVRMPPWGRVHITSWVDPDRDVMVRDGIRMATPLRTLFRLAWVFNQHRFERAAEDAWHLGLVSPEVAADYLTAIRRSGKAGVKKFERWLEHASVRTRPSQSGLELDVLDAIRKVGLPEPERQHPLVLPTGEEIHIDIAWPEVRLGVEPGHTWWHSGVLRQRIDQARDRGCGEIGWQIVRVDETVREDVLGFARQLRAIYAERRRSLRFLR